jgi:hypothetical protein
MFPIERQVGHNGGASEMAVCLRMAVAPCDGGYHVWNRPLELVVVAVFAAGFFAVIGVVVAAAIKILRK